MSTKVYAADWGLGNGRQIFTPHLHFLVSEGGMDGALFLGEGYIDTIAYPRDEKHAFERAKLFMEAEKAPGSGINRDRCVCAN